MFFSQLEKLCKERKTTPSTVGRELGYSMGSVGHWRKGNCPSGDKVVLFADYFGVTTDYLLKGDSADGIVNASGSNIRGSVVQGINNSSVVIHNGNPKEITDEASELLNVYQNLDASKKKKMLKFAFSLEE